MAGSPYDRIRARLPRPEGDQAAVVALPPHHHHVVLGTAGSGKTTMAMLRALFLADERTDHAGRTLLVTFNKSLLAYLNFVLDGGSGQLDVRNYHHFARGYVASRQPLPYGSILDDAPRRRLITEARSAVRARRTDQVLERAPGFFVAELDWIANHGVTDEAAYQSAERVGRHRSLPPAARPAVWAVREEYLDLRASRGQTYDWRDLASGVCDHLRSDHEPRIYRHVVIDEGQDFSPEMLRSLVLAVGREGSITFFGDVAQQIYGRGISWRSAGLRVQRRLWEFKRNYRNSPQIAALGLAIANMPYFADQEDMVAPDRFADDGPPPTLVRFTDGAAEQRWSMEQAVALGRVGATAVLFRRDEDASAFSSRCPNAQRLDRDTPAWHAGPGVWVGTVHAAKGFEFQSVIVSGVSSERWPEPQAVLHDGLEEAQATDGRLLYVAITRARQNLLMTTCGAPTDLLPPADKLWIELEP